MSSTSNGRLIDRRGPPWFDFGRRVVLFAVGVYAILYALHTGGHDVAFLVTGLILTSTIPIEDALRALTRREDTRMTETRDDETTDDAGTDDAGAEILTGDDAGEDDDGGDDAKHALI